MCHDGVLTPRTAIAHEWLAARAGSEKTFEAMAQALPQADLYALSLDPTVEWRLDRQVRTTFLDHAATRDRRALTLPLMPLAWRWSTREKYDLVITSSHACAKGFRPAREARHLSYTYTPMRYAWLSELDGRRVPRVLTKPVQMWDRHAATWVDEFAGISHAVVDRIRDLYGRDATVVWPPVDTSWFTPGDEPADDFVLAFGRFIDYKRFDVLVDLARASDLRVVVAGRGPLEPMLRAAADQLPNLELEVSPDDERVRTLYRGARAVVFPGIEDFGIVPVEAQACGTPVIAFRGGGALDTVIDGQTGVLVDDVSPAALLDGLDRLERLDANTVARASRANAERFATDEFLRRFRAWVDASA